MFQFHGERHGLGAWAGGAKKTRTAIVIALGCHLYLRHEPPLHTEARCRMPVLLLSTGWLWATNALCRVTEDVELQVSPEKPTSLARHIACMQARGRCPSLPPPSTPKTSRAG